MRESWLTLWENQHPSVRGNLRWGLGAAAITASLHVATLLALQWVEAGGLFAWITWLELYQTLLLLFSLIMAYNTLRVVVAYMRGRGVFTALSALLSLVALVLMAASMFNLPDVFVRSVVHQTGRPYGQVVADVRAVCDRWAAQWGEEETISLNLINEDVGPLAAYSLNYRLSDTVFFNFGVVDGLDFGLACAINDERPPDFSRAADYVYKSEGGRIYQFVERPRED